ncbi:yD repeat-containing protein [Eubacterium sp. CAG:841]|nr:yD repeat-containing protein [Eubacterium sp. CAG:841]
MKNLLTLLLAALMISAVIFITACEDKHTELPAITISSTSKEQPPETTTKENVETTSPVVKEPIESSNVKKAVYYRDDGTISSEYEYNENGYIISETLYDTDGKKSRYRAYLGTGVENDSTLTEEIRYDALNGEETYHHKYEYDENGRLIKDTAIPGASMTYEYDENGRVIRRSTILSDGSLKDYYIIEYTAVGRKESRYSWEGVLWRTTEYSGEKIKSSVSYSYIGTNISSYTVSVYNSNGRKAKETNYDGNGTERSSSEYEYNENGFRTFERRYKAGVLDYVLEYPGKDYAEHYIKKTEYSPDGSIRNIYYS